MTLGTALYLGQRLMLVAASALLVSSIVFIGVHQLPGTSFLSEHCRGSCEATLIHHYGLDRPWPVQYLDWLAHLARGDLD